jgi:hypothetical protein
MPAQYLAPRGVCKVRVALRLQSPERSALKWNLTCGLELAIGARPITTPLSRRLLRTTNDPGS